MSARQNVQVVCRFRPLNQREKDAEGFVQCKVLDDKSLKTQNRDPTEKPMKFSFDHVFAPDCAQQEVYKHTAEPLLRELFNGYNTTIFAYGQTGSGKTYTMMGDTKVPELKGIIPNFLEGVFNKIEESSSAVEFTVKLSYVEIYNEKIRDLINPTRDNMKIRESAGGVWVQDVAEHYVSNYDQVLDFIAAGQSNRAMAATSMNDQSSRSHSVFIMTLGQHFKDSGVKKGAKLFLVDLAGSEKIQKTKAAGQTLVEAQHINKSLSALGNVINALTSKKTHIPYRDSKLTRLLSDSLGGNSKTCLVITCSPSNTEADETLSTCRFGNRAKQIKNKPTVNEEKGVGEYKRLLANAHKQIELQKTIIIVLRKNVALLKDTILKNNIAMPKLHDVQIVFEGGTCADSKEGTGQEGASTDTRMSAGGGDLWKVVTKNEELKSELEKTKAIVEAKEAECAELQMVQEQRDHANSRLQQLAAKFGEFREGHKTLVTAYKDTQEQNALLKQKMESQEKEQHFTIKTLQVEKEGLARQLNDALTILKRKAERKAERARKKAAKGGTAAEGGAEGANNAGSDDDDDTERSVSRNSGSVNSPQGGMGLAELREEFRKTHFTDKSPRAQEPNIALSKKNDDLMVALHQKCDQYLELQLAHQSQKDLLKQMEHSLKQAEARAKHIADRPERRIRQLELKLVASKELCEKLLHSGMYWRKQRQSETSSNNKIRMPIKGGKKATAKSKKAASSIAKKPRKVNVSEAFDASGKARQDSGLDRFF